MYPSRHSGHWPELSVSYWGPYLDTPVPSPIASVSHLIVRLAIQIFKRHHKHGWEASSVTWISWGEASACFEWQLIALMKKWINLINPISFSSPQLNIVSLLQHIYMDTAKATIWVCLTRNTGEQILYHIIEENGIDLTKCTGICTDGMKVIAGWNSGEVARTKCWLEPVQLTSREKPEEFKVKL